MSRETFLKLLRALAECAALEADRAHVNGLPHESDYWANAARDLRLLAEAKL